MANITKLNLYLSESQYQKLCLLANTLGREPEEVANDAVYGYLAINSPFEVNDDWESAEDQHEILFYIPEEAAEQLMDLMKSDNYDDLDEYSKNLLLRELHTLSEKKKQ